MKRGQGPLLAALAVSLLLHAGVLGGGAWLRHVLAPAAPPARLAPPLEALLAVRPPPAAPVPRLIAPEPPPASATAAPAPPRALASRPAAPARDAAATSLRQAAEQVHRRLLYPPEAIARGLEGEAVVMLFLDADGNAVAARLEESSGHAILDEAAVRAAQTVRGLPNGAAREFLLPVRFRLR